LEVIIDDDATPYARYCGRVETNQWSISDPAIGRSRT